MCIKESHERKNQLMKFRDKIFYMIILFNTFGDLYNAGTELNYLFVIKTVIRRISAWQGQS
jgi:hypothetical protein